MIPVAEIRPGFTIELPRGGPRTVRHVESYEDGTHVVVYFQHGEDSYENRAGAKGARHHNRLVLRSLRPLRAGDSVPGIPGDPKRAELLKRALERAEAERFERLLDRIYA